METFYLIDYENVGSEGLSGCEKLKEDDRIIIFFTKNAKKIDMSEIADHGDARLDMIEVPAGKQSADIHIGSFLGFLSGIYQGKECSVVIISKDKDFDNVIKFWKNKVGINARRAQKIGTVPSKKQTEKQTETNKKPTKQTESEKTTKDTKKTTSSNKSGSQKKSTDTSGSKTTKKTSGTKKSGLSDGEKKTKLNQEVMQAVSAAGFETTVCNEVAKLVSGHFGEESISVAAHNDLQATYTNYLDVYEVIKPVLDKYDKETKKSGGRQRNK